MADTTIDVLELMKYQGRGNIMPEIFRNMPEIFRNIQKCKMEMMMRVVVSLSKTLHPSCLVLVKPRKLSQIDRKIVDSNKERKVGETIYQKYSEIFKKYSEM